jgi:hypothetical protein
MVCVNDTCKVNIEKSYVRQSLFMWECYMYDFSSLQENLEYEVKKCLCKCYIYSHTIVLLNVKNPEWDECFCECYTCDAISQVVHEKLSVR